MFSDANVQNDYGYESAYAAIMPDDLTAQLNPVQQAIVTAPRGNQFVLAGAGSGKTRVLVHRIAWLIHVEKISASQILAVTFTNKAAREMLSRIERLAGWSVAKMWVGTFHGLAHRFLRLHWQEAELDQNFQVIDSDDQLRLIRRVIKNLDLSESKWSPKVVQNFINSQKDAGLRAEQLGLGGNSYDKKLIQLYAEYESICQRTHLVDFAELLLRNYELLKNNDALLEHYQSRFAEILVDEFQDTNTIQYQWLQLLRGSHNFMTAVGDDDQSIYSWRGAKASNIQRFCDDFKPEIRRLEQNYRSTKKIIAAADSLIAQNCKRMGKNLWTDGADGEDIQCYAAFNEVEEAHFILEQIRDLTVARAQYERRQCAILYRSNAQSRVLEEALRRAGVPYRIYGGLRFFERAEIKDAMSYLRLVVNHHDDAAFERVINQPARGIGERTLQVLREHARECNCSLWDAATTLLQQHNLAKRTHTALEHFIQLIEAMTQHTQDVASAAMNLSEQTAHIIERSGLIPYYREQDKERAQTRIENLAELVSSAAQFDHQQQGEPSLGLTAFIASSALEAGEEFRDPDADCVQLMTLHSAKGLEFPVVFICGLEEGLFPHQMSIQSPAQLEEERRLCYVGMTRAMQRLYLTYAEKRVIHGRENYHRRSRFLAEIPEDMLHEVRKRRATLASMPQQSSSRPMGFQSKAPVSFGTIEFRMGQTVEHPAFGEGVVMNFEGMGANVRVLVNFADHGPKWLLAAYAKLQVKTED